ncbi:pilus assembly protein FimV [Pseudomonas linyingensis]|uniref:Pilus assembly protein FimV n=1 Tax=Pseudomonas linyingensis TaxID=915471 RepID=A0A1H6X9V1_9PSED|nr:FimV/HubP family polar landmark protein [Pseudomonas linyingensis]SEJ23377.1 pilus assembly protein FimV [Pseudomonas linyingensis]
MVRVRKLVLAIAAASALTSGMAHALGLGEISLKSALNQPLDAEIELLEVRDLGGNEVLPSLAAVEEFNKVGVDRPYFLTDLKFTPMLKPNGKSVIRVTSSKPVREPYLNFLIEVLWPNGRLLREYTVLLDPPLYSPQTVVAATPRLPQAAPLAPRVSAPAPVSRPQPSVAEPAAPAPVASSAPSRLEGDQYRVGRDDTLWEIAERARPSGALSVHQTMLAIQDLNPEAFLGGNINRMKSGQVLRLPSEQQIRSRSQADALAQVAAQNSAWREGRAVQPVASAARQLDATRRSEAGNAPAQAPAEDNLRLVSAASGKSTSGSDSGAAADSQGLADKLALNQESLATSQRENQELKERLGDLQSQLDKLQRLIELKNEQLAKLQGGLAADAADAAAPAAADSAPATMAEPTPVAPAAVQPVGEAAVEAPLESEPQAETVDAAAATPAPAAEPAAEAATPVVAESKPAPVVEAPKPAAVKPVAQPVAPAPVYEPSLVDEVLANPLLLAAGGGALALLAGLGLLAGSRRKARKQAEEEAQLFQEVGELPGASAVTSAADQLLETGLSAKSPTAPGGAPLASADPLGEAEMYSTYGRFTQAAEILSNAVNEEPQRADLRLKLMEVYAEMGDREGFVRQETELGEIGGAQPQIDQLRARYPQILASGAAIAGGAALAATVDGLDVEVDEPQVLSGAVASQQQADDEFSFDDLSLDDLSLDAAPGETSAPAAELNDGFDLSLDDLEAELERELAANSGSAAEQPLELDELTLDGLEGELAGDLASFELTVAEPAAVAAADTAAAGDDLAFDLDLAALELPATAQPMSGEDDFDFALDEPLSTAAAAPGGVEQSDEDLFAELDQLSLGEPLQETASAGVQSDDALMAELDQLVLDTPVATAPAAADETDDFLLDLADLELDEPVAAPLADVQAEPAMAALPELDELELELQALSGTDAEQDLDAAFDEFLAQSGLSTEGAVDALAAAPVAEAQAELPALDDLVIEPAPALTGEEDFNFLADTDETATKLDLARAYIDMGDADGARDILDEVLKEGSASQQQEAREMMGRIA